MTRDHLGEFLIGLEPLPLEAGAPVVEEAPGPAFAFVTPQLAERLLEQVGRVETLVGGEQLLQRTPAIQGEVLAIRQQGVLLSLDVPSILATEPGVLGFRGSSGVE